MYPFKDGSYAPRNGWYVAAFPHEITRTLLTRWILNEPVVLYRKENGEAVAIGGRCPHRHFPLGESKLIGDTIQCGYHGITFGPDGRCVRIPSQASVPAVYRVAKYPLVEKGLWMWIWPGSPELANEDLIPTPEEIGLNAPGIISRPFYSLDVKGRYQLLNDNLLDLTHLGFLHRTSIGTEDNAAIPEERDLDARRLRSRRYMRDTAVPELTAKFTGFRGLIDRVSGMDFFFPGFHAGIEEASISKVDPNRQGEVLRRAKVWHAVTPSTLETARYFFAISR